MPEISFIGVLLIILSTIFVDADHYVYYLFKKRDFNPIRAYKWFRAKNDKFKLLSLDARRKVYKAFYFFHGLELPLLSFLLTFLVSEYFAFLFIGIFFHLLLDYYDQWPESGRKDKISLIYDFLKFRKLRYLEWKRL